MSNLPNVGDILLNPERFAIATQAWVQDNSIMLGGVALGALAVSGAAGFGWAAIAKWAAGRRDDKRRFGGLAEARKANLLWNPKLKYSGIPLGRIGRKRLCWIDQEVVLVTGGPRSGKGTGVIRPACVTYGGPTVMYDGGKGELFRDTAGHRAKFSHILNFDLTDPSGVHFNFLDEVDRADPVAGADDLAKAIPRPEKSDDHFEESAERMIAAVILHVLHGEPDDKKNMAEVARLVSQGDVGMEHIVAANAHQTAVNRINVLFNGDAFGERAKDGAKYRQSIYGSAVARLSAFESPVVAEITSRSDFRMRDLCRLSPKKRPTTLYLTTPASADARLKPVVSMFLSLFISSVMREQPALDKEPRTLLVIDEFATLRMKIIETAITKLGGVGCTMLLGAQSLNALRQAPYGPNNMFRDCIRCHVAYAANDTATQQDISQACGTTSERRTSTSKSRQTGTWAGSSSETESQTEVPVMNPGKVREMKDDVELIIITGQPVIKAKKIRDFEDRILKKRLYLPMPPMRGADGVYPDLPHPARPGAWAGVMVSRPATPQEEDDAPEWADIAPEWAEPVPAAAPAAKPKRKRRLIAATGDE